MYLLNINVFYGVPYVYKVGHNVGAKLKCDILAHFVYSLIPIDIEKMSAKWLECLPTTWETGVQSQFKSYKRLKKLYLMPPCLKQHFYNLCYLYYDYVKQETHYVPAIDELPTCNGTCTCNGTWKFTKLFFCLDVAQGHMKGAPNETRTHSCRFSSRAC